MGKYVIKQGKNDQFYFNLKADNGQSILASQGYSTKTACLNGIESVKKNSSLDERYEIKTSANDKHYFNLKAANSQVIGKSEMYESESGMKKGIESVKKNGPGSPVVEEAVV